MTRRSAVAAVGWPLLVALAVTAYALVPALLEPEFYVRGDSAAQFAPTWWHLGQLLRAGQVPPVLDPGSFAGGNYAAEALFGVYNPVNWLIWLVVSGSGDLRVAVTGVKAAVMVALALGTYALCREYAAERWAAAVVAVAVPFGGFTLFWDAGSWAAGLVAFAWTPWVWWAFRRVLHGRLNPFWGFVVGALGVTQGNPYGTLAVALLGFGLLVEGVVLRRWRGVGLLAVVGVAVAALLPLVYLPLVETVSLAARSGGPPVMNNGRLRPTLADLALLGAPTHVPPIEAITGPMRVPTTYFCWFLVPLLPFLRLGGLRRRGTELVGLGVVGLVWLAMTAGPSKLWLFRWPLRLSEYLYLCLALLLALLLSQGLARDRLGLRSALSVLLVLLTAWFAWAQDPELARRVGLGTLAVLALTVVALLVHRAGPTRVVALAAVLVLGTGGVLALQVRVFGENASSRVWHLPTDVAQLQRDFAPYGDGTLLQVADLKPVQERGTDAELRAQWSSYLAGSMFRVAGLDAVNSYTGLGLVDFTRSWCSNYDGLALRCGWKRLWQPVEPGQPSLADLMKLETVVTQPRIAASGPPEAGWSRDAAVPGDAVVVRRDAPLPYPGSRFAWVSDGVDLTDARTLGPQRERAEVSAPAGGRLVLATLGWPGYSATLDGEPVDVGRNAVGLLQLDLPPGAAGELDVVFAPPGQRVGLTLAAGGAAVSLALGVVVGALRLRRRLRRAAAT